jgi:UDP-N-acetylmuramyl pentapeptide synthase
MTLLQLPPSAAACVLELGMSRLGEIALLADICLPTVQPPPPPT